VLYAAPVLSQLPPVPGVVQLPEAVVHIWMAMPLRAVVPGELKVKVQVVEALGVELPSVSLRLVSWAAEAGIAGHNPNI
jgi:hypothetical protein